MAFHEIKKMKTPSRGTLTPCVDLDARKFRGKVPQEMIDREIQAKTQMQKQANAYERRYRENLAKEKAEKEKAQRDEAQRSGDTIEQLADAVLKRVFQKLEEGQKDGTT